MKGRASKQALALVLKSNDGASSVSRNGKRSKGSTGHSRTARGRSAFTAEGGVARTSETTKLRSLGEKAILGSTVIVLVLTTWHLKWPPPLSGEPAHSYIAPDRNTRLSPLS